MEGIMADVYRHEIGALRKRIGEVLKDLEDIQADSRNFTTNQDIKLNSAITKLKETQ